MTRLRNPVLFVICLILLANLLYTTPQRGHVPHARRDGRGASPAASPSAADHSPRESDAAFGQVLYAANCTACHGPHGHGLPRQGVNLRESKFIAELTDAQLVAFLRQGRTPADPGSVMGMLMPPRGGNRTLDDPALADVVAFIRELQEEARQEAAAAATGGAAPQASSVDQ
jgi:mono/diheme cytochrome c family protein